MTDSEKSEKLEFNNPRTNVGKMVWKVGRPTPWRTESQHKATLASYLVRGAASYEAIVARTRNGGDENVLFGARIPGLFEIKKP